VTSIDTAGGDSGGPVYGKRYVPDDKVAIVGLHSGHVLGTETGNTVCGNTEFDDSIEAAACMLHTNYGMNFGEGGTVD